MKDDWVLYLYTRLLWKQVEKFENFLLRTSVLYRIF